MAVKLHWVSWVGSVLGMISIVILAVGGDLLSPCVGLLSLAVHRHGFYGIHIDCVIARVLIALLRPYKRARLGFQSFSLGTKYGVCSAIFFHDFM
jgi:hypothetical protein